MEITKQACYLQEEPVETIYFGGGTPSVLTTKELDEILNFLQKKFSITDGEITLEANPDDLQREYLSDLRRVGINRLSIGIQSLQDKQLQKMNRRHNAQQAVESVNQAAETGFENISIDLIYGLPGLKQKDWKKDLETCLQLPVQHLSSYHLTYHEGTAFYTWLRKGTLRELSEEESTKQFKTLVEIAGKHGFEQYEISNFAKNNLYSRHNSSYWLGQKYLGLGPSSHSFNGEKRSWNRSNLEQYIQALEKEVVWFDEELLSATDKYNEYVLTRLRTIWGVSETEIMASFGARLLEYFRKSVNKYVSEKLVMIENGTYTLSKKGMFISDKIISDVMMV